MRFFSRRREHTTPASRPTTTSATRSGSTPAARGIVLDGVSYSTTVTTPVHSGTTTVQTQTQHIVTNVSCTLPEASIAIIGTNGSGKSTLLRLMAGLTLPTSGQVSVNGNDTRTARKLVRNDVGFIFSNADNQIIMPTVVEDVAFSLRAETLTAEERSAKVQAALERFGITHLAEKQPHVLSGGEKQLLALAAIMVSSPTVLFADEPTTLLDLKNRRRIIDVLAACDEQTIIATHDLELAATCDRALWVSHGAIAADGSPAEVIRDYQAWAEG